MIRPAPSSRQLALDVALTAAVFGFSVAQMATEAFGAKAGQARGADMVGVAVCGFPAGRDEAQPRSCTLSLGGTALLGRAAGVCVSNGYEGYGTAQKPPRSVAAARIARIGS